MKKIIALAASAAIILSVGYYVFLALGSNTTPLPENSTIYDPKTSLLTAVKEDGTVDFADSAFKAQFKYYSSAYVDAKNSISSNGYTIGGTTIGGPNNWSRYCAYAFSEDSDILSSKLVTSSGENRLVFTAEETGEYTILPYQIDDGGSLSLSVGGGLSAFGENSVDFKIFETRSNKTVFSATLDAETPTANIAKGDGGNITVFLCEGDEIYFTTTTTASWHDVSNNSITLQSNFKISYDTTQNYDGTEVYEPSAYLKGSVVPNSDIPDYSAGVFRPDAAYYREQFLTMSRTMETDTAVTIGNIGEYAYNYWYRYCAFTIQKDDTAITSKMATGNDGSANRIVFIAPYSAYYDIVPRGLKNEGETSIELDLGDYAEEFETNTANFKVLNPQTEQTYTDVTLYADDGNGNANLTGNIEEIEDIYLEKGQMLCFETSTTVPWFEYNFNQTVWVEFDFEIFMTQKAEMQEYYRAEMEPLGLMELPNVLSFETKYPLGEYQEANCISNRDGFILFGNKQNYNWDKYAAIEVSKGAVTARLANENCGAKMMFKAPVKTTYDIQDSYFSIRLGNYEDRFPATDNITLTISKTSGSNTSPVAEYSVTKESRYVYIENVQVELNKNDVLTFEFTTTADWFEEAEYQTVSAELSLEIGADFKKDVFVNKTCYSPVTELMNAAEGIPTVSEASTAEEHETDFSDCVFTPFNQYYSYAKDTQYGSFIGGALYTYGYTYYNGEDGRQNQLLRGSFKIGGENENAVTAIIGKEGEDCIQTLTFTAPESDWYAFNPLSFSEIEPGFIKNVNGSVRIAKAKVRIYKNNERFYFSDELSLNESEVLTHSKLFYLQKGDTIRFEFEGADTTWNTDLRLAVNFNICRVEFN